jgi:GxxExxY protein
LVENMVVVELKAVDNITPIHQAQLMTYLKLTGCRLGLLLNFNVTRMVDGTRRIVLGLPSTTPFPGQRLPAHE